ncbi:MAG: fluoride efflux transporter CrcB [Bacteroidales bacterium]|nr:fluoride efflux transporter CrcB [Bacteroidales bacterium]
MVKTLAFIGFGGFLGSITRYLISRYFQLHLAALFPWGTFVVNLAGCFLLGVVYSLSEKGNLLSPELRLFLAVGFCGGFTTFSTFSHDALMLAQQQEWLRFSLYASLSFFLGLAAVFAGKIVIQLLWP